MESGPDKLARVQQMANDKGETWDLSPKDQLALRHVLGLVDILANEVAAYSGKSLQSVLERCHEDA